MFKFLVTLILLTVYSSVGLGQKSNFYDLIYSNQIEDAENYIKSIKADFPNGSKWKFYDGILKIVKRDAKQGIVQLEAVKSPPSNAITNEKRYWLGLGYFYLNDFEGSKKYLEQYLTTIDKKKEKFHLEQTKILLAHIENAKNFISKNSDYLVSNLGENINTKYFEHSPVFNFDGTVVYFTSATPVESEKKKQPEMHENIKYSSLSIEDEWQPSEELAGRVNSTDHEGIIQLFDKDRKMLLFKPTGNGDIYISERLGDFWTEPVPFNAVNSNFSESHATISKDGNTVIFSSNRKNKTGKFNLFLITKNEKEAWSKPKLLPETINNNYSDEDYPFLSDDGKTLYYSSNGPKSFGGFDIFKVDFNEASGTWGEPENLQRPINSSRDEVFFRFNEELGKGIFTSNRPGGFGRTDIYTVERPNETLIRGYVGVTISEERLKNNLKAIFKNAKNNKEFIAPIDALGLYQIALKSDSEYEITILENDSVIHKERLQVKPSNEGSLSFQDVFIGSTY